MGHKFVLLGKLSEGFDFFEVMRGCRSLGISNYSAGGYSHREFYEKATRVGGREADVFLMDDELLVLPCENELFEYRGRFESVPEVSQKD